MKCEIETYGVKNKTWKFSKYDIEKMIKQFLCQGKEIPNEYDNTISFEWDDESSDEVIVATKDFKLNEEELKQSITKIGL